MERLAGWLYVSNEGDEAYPLRRWLIIAHEDADVYRQWFDREWVADKPLYVTHFIALHRLLFAINNNIMILKSTIKTNMEHNVIFYLCHLLSLDDIKTSFLISFFSTCLLLLQVKIILDPIFLLYIR
jgi:hypothetical protein